VERTTLWSPCSPPCGAGPSVDATAPQGRLFPARPFGLPGVDVSTRTRYGATWDDWVPLGTVRWVLSPDQHADRSGWYGAGRSVGSRVGSVGASLAEKRGTGRALDEPPQGDQRHSLPAADRHPMARPADTVWEVEDGARQASPVVGGRDVGENPAGHPVRRRRRRPDRLEHGQRGLDLLPCPSTCRRRPHCRATYPWSARSACSASPRRGSGSVSGRAHLQDPSGQ